MIHHCKESDFCTSQARVSAPRLVWASQKTKQFIRGVKWPSG